MPVLSGGQTSLCGFFTEEEEPAIDNTRAEHSCYSLGLTQAKAAKIIGVDPTTVGDWEAGRHKPLGSSLRKALRLLK
jgi:DNA-binding XRE family transcriptional regulator